MRLIKPRDWYAMKKQYFNLDILRLSCTGNIYHVSLVSLCKKFSLIQTPHQGLGMSSILKDRD